MHQQCHCFFMLELFTILVWQLVFKKSLDNQKMVLHTGIVHRLDNTHSCYDHRKRFRGKNSVQKWTIISIAPQRVDHVFSSFSSLFVGNDDGQKPEKYFFVVGVIPPPDLCFFLFPMDRPIVNCAVCAFQKWIDKMIIKLLATALSERIPNRLPSGPADEVIIF